jgi:hypothetical protein
VICGFYRKVDENCAFLGYYAASSGNYSPTFRDDLSAPFKVKNPLKMGPIGSKTLVRTYHYSLRKNPEESSSQLDRSPPRLGMNGGIRLLPLIAFMVRAGKALPFIAVSPNTFVWHTLNDHRVRGAITLKNVALIVAGIFIS